MYRYFKVEMREQRGEEYIEHIGYIDLDVLPHKKMYQQIIECPKNNDGFYICKHMFFSQNISVPCMLVRFVPINSIPIEIIVDEPEN